MRSKLFKRTAAGIYEWEITQYTGLKDAIITTKYGLINGQKVAHSQAGDAKKAESLVKKKRTEGYKSLTDLGIENTYKNVEHPNYDEIGARLPAYSTDANDFAKVMKCKPAVPGKFDYGPVAYAQPKINGNRATISWGEIGDGLFKKNGAVIKSHEGIVLNVEHIRAIFDTVFEHCDKNIVFDGELYARNEPVTTISGACRNDKNPVNKKLQYHCFDLAIPDVDQHNRLALRDKILSAFAYKQKSPFEHNNGTLDYPVIVNVLSVKIQSDAESTLFRDDCIDAGYEGCVTRNGLAEYKFGSRPKTIMKWKKAKYGSFEVIDIIKFGFDNTDNNNHVGKGVLFVLKNDINPLTFESRPIGDLDQQMEMIAYKSKIIGTKVTVRYFERTEDGKPFHTNVIDVK